MNAEEILKEILVELVGRCLPQGNVPKQHAEMLDNLATEALERFRTRCEQLDQIDGKFFGLVWRRRDNQVEEQFVCFVPRDNLLLNMLLKYYQTCVDMGCGAQQCHAVRRLADRVFEWRDKNQDKCKMPDVDPEEKLKQ